MSQARPTSLRSSTRNGIGCFNINQIQFPITINNDSILSEVPPSGWKAAYLSATEELRGEIKKHEIANDQLTNNRKQKDAIIKENEKLTKENEKLTQKNDKLNDEIKKLMDRFGNVEECEHGGFIVARICQQCCTR